jgi:hypothetical protein
MTLAKAAHEEAKASDEPFWPGPVLFPILQDEPDTNLSTSLPSIAPVEVVTLNTNSVVVTPQMLVPFFRMNGPVTNSNLPSTIVPINLAPVNPGPPPSSKATLTTP